MATTTSSSSAKEPASAHVLLLPYPGAQGHTNPLLQFGRRLAHYGLHPTLVTTRYVLSTTPPPDEPFSVAAISDGGAAACPDSGRRLEALGAETLADLITTEAREGRSVHVLRGPHLLCFRCSSFGSFRNKIKKAENSKTRHI
jgi:hypothetical protein